MQLDSSASTCVDLHNEFESLLDLDDPVVFLDSLRPTMRKASLEDLEDFLNMAESLQNRHSMPIFAEAMHKWIFIDLDDFCTRILRTFPVTSSPRLDATTRFGRKAVEGMALHAQRCLRLPYSRYDSLVDSEFAYDLVHTNNGGPEIAVLKEVISGLRGKGYVNGDRCLRVFRDSYVASVVGSIGPIGNDERFRALLVLSHGLPAITHNRDELSLQTVVSNAKTICALLGWDRALHDLLDKLVSKFPSARQETWFFCGKLYVRACCFVAESRAVENQRRRVEYPGCTTSLPFPFLDAALCCFQQCTGRADVPFPDIRRWRACQQGGQANLRIDCIKMAKEMENDVATELASK